MRSLAAFIMAGRVQAVASVWLLGLLSWVMPFFSLLAAAAVALPTLRKGAAEGGIVTAGALVLLALAGGYWLGSLQNAAGYGLLLWVPAWLAAIVLRESGHLALALVGIAGLGMLAVLAVYGFFPDPPALWRDSLQSIIKPILDNAPDDLDTDRLTQGFMGFARYLTGIAAAGSALSLALSLFIARWWQAGLFNPGGFRGEFLALRLPVSAAYAGIGLIGMAAATGGKLSEVAWNLAFPCFAPFLLAGFSVLHALCAGNDARRFWLYGIYAALVFIPHALLPILLLGFSDPWVDWRQRLRPT
jgi:hypothetical protein